MWLFPSNSLSNISIWFMIGVNKFWQNLGHQQKLSNKRWGNFKGVTVCVVTKIYDYKHLHLFKSNKDIIDKALF